MIRYWLTPPATDPQFDAKVTDVCTLYRDAPALAERGERCVSTDELTGVQATNAASELSVERWMVWCGISHDHHQE